VRRTGTFPVSASDEEDGGKLESTSSGAICSGVFVSHVWAKGK
jgi:hypothetical protein